MLWFGCGLNVLSKESRVRSLVSRGVMLRFEALWLPVISSSSFLLTDCDATCHEVGCWQSFTRGVLYIDCIFHYSNRKNTEVKVRGEFIGS